MTKIKIDGYEEYYSVDNDGNIYSTHGKDRLLKQSATKKSGYLFISLSKDLKQKRISAHRLIAITLIPNPENKPQVNHIDGNKTNNHPSNLEWCTASENKIHSMDVLGIGSNLNIKSVRDKATAGMKRFKAVIRDEDEASEIVEMIQNMGMSIREASRVLGIGRGVLSRLCKGEPIAYKIV